MAGCENIINKILADAKSFSDNLLSQANESASEILKEGEVAVESYKASQASEIEKEAKQIIERRSTVAKLDSRKVLLKAKQDAISKCFDEAKKAIMSMDKKDYLDVCKKSILENAQSGDEVILSSTEKYIDKDFLAEISKELGFNLAVSEKTSNHVGGVILTNKILDKNLSISSLLDNLRAEIDVDVAKILFDKN